MGVHAYRFPIRFSPVHTYDRLCFKKTIFHSHWPKSIPMFSLSSSEIKVWSTNLSLWVLLRNGLTQNITGTQWLRNSVESSKVGLFGFKSRHNNKLKHLTLRTCCKSWKHELKDTKLAVKSVLIRPEIRHCYIIQLSPFTVRKTTGKTASSRLSVEYTLSAGWDAQLKSNSGYLWTPPDKVFWIQICQLKHVVSFSHDCCAVSKNLIFFI